MKRSEARAGFVTGLLSGLVEAVHATVRIRSAQACRAPCCQIAVFVVSLALFGSGGCVSPPRLTAEDRKSDIEFLARWAKDYHVCAELNEKYKGTPSYEDLLPKYVKFAEEAETDEEFCLVVLHYFNVIGASGHAYLVPDDWLKGCAVGWLLGIDWGIAPWHFQQARYWPRVAGGLSPFAHPPFRVTNREGRYLTDDDWQYGGTTVPKGSEILKVNGMTCSDYLYFVKTETVLKYDPYKDRLDRHLMLIDEGPSFGGWQVDFRLPAGSELSAFAAKVKGQPAPNDGQAWPWNAEPAENCTCIELGDEVAYVRIRSFLPTPESYVFKGYIRRERKKIATFLKQAQGGYKKLIIDLRNNGGGDLVYFRDNLIAPFLDQPLTWKGTTGVKRKFLTKTKRSALRFLRKGAGVMHKHVQEVDPPDGFDGARWVFYEITQQVEPAHRYDFDGQIYVLINNGSSAATDSYADALKRTGIGILVGRNTGGTGGVGYLLPPMVRLPASGMIFRTEADLGINPDGGFNELEGTAPDVELPLAKPPVSFSKEGLLEDEWIKWVLADSRDRGYRE